MLDDAGTFLFALWGRLEDHGFQSCVVDAVHALFNAPIDLADHPTRAVASAIEIRKWSEQYRARKSERPGARGSAPNARKGRRIDVTHCCEPR